MCAMHLCYRGSRMLRYCTPVPAPGTHQNSRHQGATGRRMCCLHLQTAHSQCSEQAGKLSQSSFSVPMICCCWCRYTTSSGTLFTLRKWLLEPLQTLCGTAQASTFTPSPLTLSSKSSKLSPRDAAGASHFSYSSSVFASMWMHIKGQIVDCCHSSLDMTQSGVPTSASEFCRNIRSAAGTPAACKRKKGGCH